MDTQENDLFEFHINREKLTIISLEMKMGQYIVRKIKLKTKRIVKYYFDNKNEALKKYKKWEQEDKNVEM